MTFSTRGRYDSLPIRRHAEYPCREQVKAGSDNKVTTGTLLSCRKLLTVRRLRKKLPCDNKLPT